MLRSLYDWTMRQAGRRRAMPLLALVSFAESSFFPVPPDVMLVPMVLARPERAWRLAGLCTLASVIGGVAGYGIGFFLFDLVGTPLIEFYGQQDAFARFQAAYNEYGAWIVAFFGLTPFPYKVITIASGVAALDPFTFLAASVLSRGLRFYLVAALLWRFGEPVRAFIERYLGWLTLVFFLLLAGSFFLLRHLL